MTIDTHVRARALELELHRKNAFDRRALRDQRHQYPPLRLCAYTYCTDCLQLDWRPHLSQAPRRAATMTDHSRTRRLLPVAHAPATGFLFPYFQSCTAAVAANTVCCRLAPGPGKTPQTRCSAKSTLRPLAQRDEPLAEHPSETYDDLLRALRIN